MRKFFLMMMVMLGAVAINAQSASGEYNDVSKGWTSLYLQYNNIGVNHETINFRDDYYPSETANGVTLGVNHAFNVVSSLPLYVETGLGAQFAMYSDSWQDEEYPEYGGKDEYKGHLLSAKVPLNILYRFDIPNSDFAIEPQLGFDLRFNILGKAETKRYWYGYYTSGAPSIEKNEVDFFDKNEMQGKTLKRFQAGWHIGANFAYKKMFIGVQYGSDFNKIHDDKYEPKLKTFTLALGCRF